MREIVSSVTSKGQVTIPLEVRRRLGVGTPDKVAFVLDEGVLRLQPVATSVASLYGPPPPCPASRPTWSARSTRPWRWERIGARP